MRTLKMMCLFTAMCVTTISFALPALAQEKKLDSVNIKPGKAGFQMLPGTFNASSPTYDRIYGNDKLYPLIVALGVVFSALYLKSQERRREREIQMARAAEK